MVKTEPNILRGRFIELVWLCYVVYGVFYAFTRQSGYVNHFVTFLSYAFIGVINIGAGIAQERFWRRQDQHRQQAVQGEQNLIAEQQPIQGTTSLTLPLTIAQRTAKGWTTVLIVAIILLVLPFIGIVFGLASNVTDLLLIFSLLVVIAGVLALFVGVPILRGYQTLMVDERGISVRVGLSRTHRILWNEAWYVYYFALNYSGLSRTHRILWNEAKLFAISAFYKPGYAINTEMRRLPEYYELSTAQEVVRWRWVRTQSFIAIEPSLPVAEYDRQMQALLSLIVAKTGLTLYDVRPREQRL